MNWIERLWARFQDWRDHCCPICLVPIANGRPFCTYCAEAVHDVAWLSRLEAKRTAEGREE